MRPERRESGWWRARTWLSAASLGLCGLATVLILRRFRVADLSTLERIPLRMHLVVLGVVALEVLARAARVSCVARGLDVRLSLGRSVRAQIAADAWGAVTPSRIASDPAKIAVLHASGVKLGSAGVLLLAEMIVEAALLVGCASAIAVFLPSHWWTATGVFGYAAVVSLAIVLVLAAAHVPGSDPPRAWRALRLGAVRWSALHGTARELRIRAAALRKLPARWAVGAFVAGAVHVAARAAILPLLALPLMVAGASEAAVPSAINLGLAAFFVLYTTALLPLPGGGGGVEVVFATVLGGAMGAVPTAAALVWWRVYTFYLIAGVGWLSLAMGRPGRRAQGERSPAAGHGDGAQATSI